MSVINLLCEKRNIMKQKSVVIQFLCTFLAGSTLYAVSEFRTPLDFMRAPYLRYQLKPITESFWYYNSEQNNNMDDKIKDAESSWGFDISSGLYGRAASKAFGNKCQNQVTDPCQSSCDRDKKVPLAALWFGQASFVAEQAFAGGMITNTADLSDHPALAFSTITPQFKYTEKGAWVGAHADYRFGRTKHWGIGVRASIPFKAIEVEPTLGDDSIEGGLASVFEEEILEVDASGTANVFDYAYRLDFLSALVRPSLTTPALMFNYGTSFGSAATKIGGTFIGATSPSESVPNIPPVYVIKKSTGVLPEPTRLPNTVSVPTYTFGKQASQVQTAALPVTGDGVDGNVYFFDNTSNYAVALGTNRAAQSTLFVVPRIIYSNDDNEVTGGPTSLASNAVMIRSAINELINQFDFNSVDSATVFLRDNCCTDLGKYERVLGVGDLQTEFYGGYTSKKWYTNGVLGVLFPTGKQHKNPNHVYHMQTGNNGHFELRVGGEFGWGPCNYFDMRADIFYNHIFKRTEKRAAPFKGATIKNIGAPIDVDVSWDAITGHIDINLFNPYNKELGISVGYEGYYRTKDRVGICQTTAVDCLGNTQPLDPCVMEKGTSTVSHKIRAEIFNRSSYFEFFIGGSQVVAGRNVMQETEAHIGTVIYF